MIKKLFFIYVAMLLIISEPCWSMQKKFGCSCFFFKKKSKNRELLKQSEIKPLPISQKENKDLKTIFADHKQCLIQYKIEPVPTSQNINMFLWHVTSEGCYPLVKEIIEAMDDLIEQYTQLYQAVRDGEKGIETLRTLLKKSVNPNGYNLHDRVEGSPIMTAYNAFIEAESQLNRMEMDREYAAEGFWDYAQKHKMQLSRPNYVRLKKSHYREHKETYEQIYNFLNQKIIEKESPLNVALSIKNYAAIELLLAYNAYDFEDIAQKELTRLILER